MFPAFAQKAVQLLNSHDENVPPIEKVKILLKPLTVDDVLSKRLEVDYQIDTLDLAENSWRRQEAEKGLERRKWKSFETDLWQNADGIEKKRKVPFLAHSMCNNHIF